MELTVGGKSLAVVEIQRSIFQRDALSPLLFVIATMQLNHIFRKCTGVHKLTKPPNVHGRHQTVCQKGKGIGNLNTGREYTVRIEVWNLALKNVICL